MWKITRGQACNLIRWASADRQRFHGRPIRNRDVTKLAGNGYGAFHLLRTGASLYRYKDRSGQPAYAVVGYAADGSDVRDLYPYIF